MSKFIILMSEERLVTALPFFAERGLIEFSILAITDDG